MKTPTFAAVVLFMVIAGSHALVEINTNIHHKSVERNIDLTTQLVKVQYKITLEQSSKSAFNGEQYSLVVPYIERQNLSYISITDSLKKDLKPVEEDAPGLDGVTYTVKVTSSTPSPILYVDVVFTQSLHPAPAAIAQSERQLVQYHGNAYFFTPYKTVTQKTTFQLASKSIESFTTVKPTAQSDNKITYGPYENVEGK